MEDLTQLLADGRRAAQYVRDHYKKLTTRKATDTVFGLHTYGTEAAMPGRITHKSDRSLTLKTRRSRWRSVMLGRISKLYRIP